MSLAPAPEQRRRAHRPLAPRAHLLRLKGRIQRRYATVTENVCFGSLSMLFTRIADPDRVLDEIVAEEDRREKRTGIRLQNPPHLPYWAELWDSGAAVASCLARTPPPDAAAILDLGCGMGLAGMIAAALGGYVTFADLEGPALLFARLNAIQFPGRCRFRRLDWQTDSLAERFDMILGSDILYERSQWPHLDRFWRNHIKPNGIILLGEPGRQTGDLFIPWIEAQGWKLRETQEKVPTREKPIRLFELTPHNVSARQ